MIKSADEENLQKVMEQAKQAIRRGEAVLERFKDYKVTKAMTLEELIDKYGDKYYFDVTYSKDGNVSVFFGSAREEGVEKSEDS